MKQECLPVRCVPSAAVAVCRGVSPGGELSAQWGCLPGSGVCPGSVCPGGFMPRGVCPEGCLPRGCLPQKCLPKGVSGRGCVCTGRCLPAPPVNRMADACENITLPQLRCRQ